MSGADPGGGGPGVQGPPPLVPREGVLDPSSKMKKTAFIVWITYNYIKKVWRYVFVGEKMKEFSKNVLFIILL